MSYVRDSEVTIDEENEGWALPVTALKIRRKRRASSTFRCGHPYAEDNFFYRKKPNGTQYRTCKICRVKLHKVQNRRWAVKKRCRPFECEIAAVNAIASKIESGKPFSPEEISIIQKILRDIVARPRVLAAIKDGGEGTA